MTRTTLLLATGYVLIALGYGGLALRVRRHDRRDRARTSALVAHLHRERERSTNGQLPS